MEYILTTHLEVYHFLNSGNSSNRGSSNGTIDAVDLILLFIMPLSGREIFVLLLKYGDSNNFFDMYN